MDLVEVPFSSATFTNLITQAVADISNPVELNSRLGTVVGEPCIAYQVGAADDVFTIYYWDAATTSPINSPYIVAGLSGFWIAGGGRYQSGDAGMTGVLTLGSLQLMGLITALPSNKPQTAIATTSGLGVGEYGQAGHVHIVAASSAPRDIVFWTGSTTPIERLRIANTGIVTIPGTTDSGSTTTGALIISGGAATTGSCFLGDASSQVRVGGRLAFTNSQSTFFTTAALPVLYSTDSLGTGIFAEAGTLVISPRISGALRDVIISRGTIADFKFDRNGQLSIAATTASTTTTTGALIVAGGVGIAGALNVAANSTSSAAWVSNRTTAGDWFLGQFSGNIRYQVEATAAGGANMNLRTGAGTVYLTTNAVGLASNILDVIRTDTGASTAGVIRAFAGNAVTSQTSAGVLDIILGAVEASTDILIRARSNGSNKFMVMGNGTVTVLGTTPSSSTTTGALLVSGGVGVAGAGSFGAAVRATNFDVTANTNGLTFGHDTASKFMVVGYGNAGTTNFGNVLFYDGKTSAIARFIGSTGNLLIGTGTDAGAGFLIQASTTSAATYAMLNLFRPDANASNIRMGPLVAANGARITTNWTTGGGSLYLGCGSDDQWLLDNACAVTQYIDNVKGGSASTSTTQTVHTWNRTISGTPAVGYGMRHALKGKSNTTIDRDMAAIDTTWIDATDATRKARQSYYIGDAAALRECLRFDTDGSAGSATVPGFLTVGGTSPGALLTVSTTTTGNSRAIRFIDTAGTKFNWQLGAQINVNDAFEITASTAAGGTTFTAGAGLSIAADGLSRLYRTSTSTSSNFSYLDLVHRSTGTPAAGFGGAIVGYLESSTTNDVAASTISTIWTDATHATRRPRLTFEIIDATTTREGFRIDTDGGGAQTSFFGAGSYGSGRQVIFITSSTLVPTTNPSGGGLLYVEAGALKYRGTSGTVTTLGPA